MYITVTIYLFKLNQISVALISLFFIIHSFPHPRMSNWIAHMGSKLEVSCLPVPPEQLCLWVHSYHCTHLSFRFLFLEFFVDLECGFTVKLHL